VTLLESVSIDAIGLDRQTGHVIMTIADGLDWEDEEKHLLLLQGKLNVYLRFVQSGEILESYPQAEGRRITISVVLRCPPPPIGLEFFQEVEKRIAPLGLQLRTKVEPDSE
jgi:hypothetical protein